MTEKQSGAYLGPECNLSQNPPHRLPKNERASVSRAHRSAKCTFLLSSCALKINNGFVRIVFQNGQWPRLCASFYRVVTRESRYARFALPVPKHEHRSVLSQINVQ